MEPSFYADVNEASMNLDLSKIKTLGPFARAIYGVLVCGIHSDLKRDNAIERGDGLEEVEPLGYMCKSFLLFRGALMNKGWIEDWKQKINSCIKCHGY